MCFAIVFECVPTELAAHIAKEVDVPIIGIGAGGEVDGQVLVYHDILRYGTEYAPKFVRAYADLNAAVPEAIQQFTADVKSGRFPTRDESYAPTKALLAAIHEIGEDVESRDAEEVIEEDAGGYGGAGGGR